MEKKTKPSGDEIEKMMGSITDLGYRDIGSEIMEWAQKWKLGKINDDRFFEEIRKCINAGITRRVKQHLIILNK